MNLIENEWKRVRMRMRADAPPALVDMAKTMFYTGACSALTVAARQKIPIADAVKWMKEFQAEQKQKEASKGK